MNESKTKHCLCVNKATAKSEIWLQVKTFKRYFHST